MQGSKLTDTSVRSYSPSGKDYKVSDGGGLHLLVKRNGTKCWRYSYRFSGKQKTLALGVYPQITLREARQYHADAKSLLAKGDDPGLLKQQQKSQAREAQADSFANLAMEWWSNQKGTWTEDHAQRILTRFESNVFPYIGHIPVSGLTPQEVIKVIRKIESRGALEVAQRLLRDISRVCRYAVQMGRAETNPASELTGIVKTRRVSHRASLPRDELPGFLQALEGYDSQGRLLTKLAIKLLILTFVRSGELRGAKWEEFDLENKTWRVPATRMKMRVEHIVPLSNQAIEVIEQIRSITSQYDLVFPSERHRHEPMSDNTMRRAIFRLGYEGNTPGKSKAVPHGFRATASSILNEQGFNPDAIERQLAHQERNGVRAAYIHHARYLEERAKMMQWWADFLDEMKQIS